MIAIIMMIMIDILYSIFQSIALINKVIFIVIFVF